MVEDQAFMRALVAEALRGTEFEVHSCASSSEAVTVFGAVDPDVVVTDIDFGTRPNGVELAHIMKAFASGSAIVFLTNYPTSSALSSLPVGSAFVHKGSIDSVEGLVDAVNSILPTWP